MNHKQMKTRCPTSRFVKGAILKDYRFVYDGRSTKWGAAVANVVPFPDEVVWGGLFEINDDNLAALDCYEGYPKVYQRKEVSVHDEDGTSFKTILYFREGKQKGGPAEEYRKIIKQGAVDCGLPVEYIEKIN